MIKCSDCKIKACLTENGTITCRSLRSAYRQARADAERDFQNSDYWNDYLAKVLADERTKILDAVYESGWHCEVHSREALTAMVEEQLKEKNNA